ncbi:hypothetical protein Z042_22940 [Chania multitudinisentens RB-25]|uniref:DUF7694 domain-containing protein n=1 Tax=Chania multitudinisentens RB-25 TaxID=1441930 RepID=W0LII4_9GAMM|nr:hypothetical protein Z042_22940 [Chania multitudinisentens RB-25]
MKFTPVPAEKWPINQHDSTREAVYINHEFLVQVFAEANGIKRLTINLTALGAGMRWKDGISWDALQVIKDALGFSDQDAVELYPAQADIVNVANMRHLWVLPEKVNFGWRHKQQ